MSESSFEIESPQNKKRLTPGFDPFTAYFQKQRESIFPDTQSLSKE